MDAESVNSEHSSKVKRYKNRDRNNHWQNSHRNNRTINSRKSDDMAPYQTSVTLTPESRDGQEVIEVQILPQDDNWGENTTAITGNTSDHSHSTEDVSSWPGEPDNGLSFIVQYYMGTVCTYLLSILAFVSPLAMVVLPKIGVFPTLSTKLGLADNVKLLACGAECKGQLLTLAFKMVLLVIGAWAVFLRKPNATLPRFYMFRALTLALVFMSTLSFWLFYLVQVTEAARAATTSEEFVDYKALVTYASNLTDTLLFIHYLFVVLGEIRQLQPAHYIKIIRSPDGASRAFAIGQLSIQRAALRVLEKYYTEFPIYNPYLERVPVSKSSRRTPSSFKFYDVDGANPTRMHQSQSRAMLTAHARRRDSAHNERFYEEHEYDRRVKKRRARLITAAEEAFTHIRRLHNEQSPSLPMEPHEAAQAIFPSMARALQKYLRATRQQPRHTMEAILGHLAHCLRNDLTPKAFLEHYFSAEPVLQCDKEVKAVQTWALISEDLLTRPIEEGTSFQLKQNDVSLLCIIRKLPHLHITEQVMDPKSNKFVLRLNSETSV